MQSGERGKGFSFRILPDASVVSFFELSGDICSSSDFEYCV
jgi:hypothetical protein